MEPIELPPGFYWPEDDDPDAFQLDSPPRFSFSESQPLKPPSLPPGPPLTPACRPAAAP